MADETAVSSETSEQPAPAPAAPVVDEEKERLRQQLAEARAADAEKAKALGEVGDMVRAGKLTFANEPAKAPAEEDDSALVDRKELKRFSEDIKKSVAGAIIETATQSARLTRTNTKDLMRSKLKNFDKYEAEVDALLDKMDPRVAAAPDTITQVYKVVRANHLDEEIEAEVAARAGLRDDEDEIEPAVAARIPGAMPSPSRSGVAPVGDAMNRASIARQNSSVPPLSRDERIAASLFGIKDAAEYRKYADRSWKPDLLGSKGRQKF